MLALSRLGSDGDRQTLSKVYTSWVITLVFNDAVRRELDSTVAVTPNEMLHYLGVTRWWLWLSLTVTYSLAMSHHSPGARCPVPPTLHLHHCLEYGSRGMIFHND